MGGTYLKSYHSAFLTATTRGLILRISSIGRVVRWRVVVVRWRVAVGVVRWQATILGVVDCCGCSFLLVHVCPRAIVGGSRGHHDDRCRCDDRSRGRDRLIGCRRGIVVMMVPVMVVVVMVSRRIRYPAPS